MIDYSKIFSEENTVCTTDVGELLVALVDPANSIEDKRKLWHAWQNHYYNNDDLIGFFSDTLFCENETNYANVMCGTTDYKNFYELAMSLDQANIDPRAYYLYWILKYNKNTRPIASNLLKEAMEYDPETIKSLFPDIEQVIMHEEV